MSTIWLYITICGQYKSKYMSNHWHISYHSFMSIISMSMVVCLPLPLYGEFMNMIFPQLILPDSIRMKIWENLYLVVIFHLFQSNNPLTCTSHLTVPKYNLLLFRFYKTIIYEEKHNFQWLQCLILQIFPWETPSLSSNEPRYNYYHYWRWMPPSYLSADLAKYFNWECNSHACASQTGSIWMSIHLP